MAEQEALRSRGLKDDTTCLVVDIIPSDHPVPAMTPRKKQNILSSLFGKKALNSSKSSNKLSAVGVVEELFEEGSAMLAERFVCHDVLSTVTRFLILEVSIYSHATHIPHV